MNAPQYGLIFAVRVYQWVISPVKSALFGPLGRCRFTPTCSQYAIDAIRAQGAIRGGALAAWRLCRCQPWGGCGYDPAPPRRSKFQFPKFGSNGLPPSSDEASEPALNCFHGS